MVSMALWQNSNYGYVRDIAKVTLILVSKEASGPQECSFLSRFSPKKDFRGVTKITLYYFDILFVFLKCNLGDIKEIRKYIL